MDTEFYPLCVVPAVTHGQGIRFLHPKEQYDITKFVDVIWAILAHCNGYESETRIMQQLQKEGVEGSVGACDPQ